MNAQVQWLTASPLWSELSAVADLTAYRRPAILRFATDTFMPVLQGVLQQTPQDLRNYVAQGETWEFPAAGLDNVGTLPLKLFQPVQARFYVIASSLNCRLPGLPDHTVNTNAGESVAFVVRQLRPNAGFRAPDNAVYDATKGTEYAWIPVPGVNGAPGSIGDEPEWVQVTPLVSSDPFASLVTGEQQLPLAPAQTGSNGSARRTLTGLIPASRRQQYIAARTAANGSGSGSSGGGSATPALDPRADMFNRQVVAPWSLLEDWWNNLGNPVAPTPTQMALYIPNAQQSSALILADFASFLIDWIPNVWAAIQDGSKVAGLSTAEAALYNTLGAGLRQAISDANQFDLQFEQAGSRTTFPPTLYTPYSLADPGNNIDPTTLQAPVAAALPPLNTVSHPPAPQPLPQKPSNPIGDFYFIVRCVYLRPQCGYNVVSPPSQPFQLASYFDSDAPARRIQIALPLDTSAAAFRKYDKGAAFLLPPELQNQVARVTSLLGLSNGSIGGAGGVSIGLICSFSIPIITICAFILLFVILIALNIVFFWMPFFKICLPVPDLTGKD
jgi:hypothetical protein